MRIRVHMAMDGGRERAEVCLGCNGMGLLHDLRHRLARCRPSLYCCRTYMILCAMPTRYDRQCCYGIADGQKHC